MTTNKWRNALNYFVAVDEEWGELQFQNNFFDGRRPSKCAITAFDYFNLKNKTNIKNNFLYEFKQKCFCVTIFSAKNIV